MSNVRVVTQRLLPNQDLRAVIEQLVATHRVSAGCVASVVGSLKKVTLRMAGAKSTRSRRGLFEIVSGTGTLSPDGCHIHIAVADQRGKVVGGHLKEGCIIRTTGEVVLLAFRGVRYRRAVDSTTGYDELVVC